MDISPKDQTYTRVFSACSYCGLVEEGMLFFNCMSKEFGIAHDIHYYGCVVDLFGHASSLGKAYQLITSTLVKPNLNIWRNLLGICRIHGHVTLGK